MPIILKLSHFRLITHSNPKFYSKLTSQINLLNVLKTMPKEPKHIADAQKQRKKIKERTSKYVPGKVTLQVLGTGAKGAPRALYVFSDQSRYLFNCGEGTQRLAHEHKMKLAKLEHIFITQPVWKNIGGLPGTALTIQDVGVPEITLHGPPGLDEIFVATKRFVVIRDLQIHMAECTENSKFQDNVMTVIYVPLTRNPEYIPNEEKMEEVENNFKDSEVDATIEQADAFTSTRSNKKRKRRRSVSSSSTSEEMVEDDIDYYAHEQSGSRTTPDLVSINSQQILQETKEKGISMTYICRLQPRPGALNLDKCVKLGVPPGPLLGKLKGGEAVTLSNGTVVTSKDVCEPDDPGPVFIIVDCPSEEYLDSLLDNEALKKHQIAAQNEEDLASLVVHFTPQEVVRHPRYKKWIEDFSASTHHLILNESNTCMGSQAVHRIQHKLHLLSKDLFPILGDRGTQVDNEASGIHLNKKQKCDGNLDNGSSKDCAQNDLDMGSLSVKSRPTSPTEPYIFPNTFCNYHLRPKHGLDRTSELKLNPVEYISETMVIEGFPDALQELKQNLNESKRNLTIREYPKILFLGTGSCIPNKTRNTSGILLMPSESQYILMDCGEGTYGQLVRFFGEESADQVVAKIDAVYISHLHADHHIGLIGFLQGRKRALDNLKLKREPVYLFAPKQILTWLSFYNKCFENIKKEFHLVPNADLIFDEQTIPESSKIVFLEKLGLSNISTCLVRHCPNAFGVAFTYKNGLKVTYSGDTMPSENLIALGRDSDVLIHEATMEDELAHEAVTKMHSTTSQAIEVGKKMNAKNILLTHFSQRYAKLPRFNDNFAENVGIAFDYMQVKFDELPLVPNLYPALKLMFAEHYEELEHKAVKRQIRIDRQREASLERAGKDKQKQVT